MCPNARAHVDIHSNIRVALANVATLGSLQDGVPHFAACLQALFDPVTQCRFALIWSPLSPHALGHLVLSAIRERDAGTSGPQRSPHSYQQPRLTPLSLPLMSRHVMRGRARTLSG